MNLKKKYKKYKNCRAKDGFTLIEVLLSIAMIAILSASVIQLASFSDTHKSLTLATDELRASFREAQGSSLSVPTPVNQHVCGFGVKIISVVAPNPNNEYEVFYTWVSDLDFADDPDTCKNDLDYRDGSTNYEKVRLVTLSEGLSFDPADVGETLFFGVPYGAVYDNGGTVLAVNETFKIRSTNGGDRDVIVTPDGKIN